MIKGRKIIDRATNMSSSITIMFLLATNISIPSNSWCETYIYWANTGANKIQRANLDGSDVTDVINVSGGTRDVAVDVTNEKIYWAVGSDKIRRANIDGTSTEDIVTGLTVSAFIALDVANNRLYWSEESSPGKLSRAELDGTNATALITSNSEIKYPKFIALDLTNNKVFFRSNTPTNSDYLIRRANLDGSGLEANYISGHLNSGLEGIAVDPNNSKIYYAGRDSDKIYRANLDGTGETDLITGLNDPRGIALDLIGGKIYWCDAGTDKIHRANVSDGSGQEDIVTGLSDPEGITIAILSSESEYSVDQIRYVPFASKYLLMGLMALLGGWLVLRQRYN